ncbi:MAG: magnesium transporter [Inquilinus sp.]|uniref:magnesium transporter n=1 Tax=Inquilinus sp. TaxID=1932117 RepID=UPI003F3FC7CE
MTAAPDGQTADAQEYGLPPGFVQGIEEALDDHRLAEVEERLAPLHSADLAALLEALHPDDRRVVVGLIRIQLTTDAEALAWLNEDVRQEVLDLLGPQDVAAALQELDSDDALALIETLDEGERDAVLANIPAEERRVLLEGLDFPEYSAGRLMQRELVSVPDYWTVGKTIDWLRTADDLPDEFYSLFLVDLHGNPRGQLPLSRFLRGRRPAKLAELELEDIHPIPAEMDQEEVALLFRRYGMVSAPVVDGNGKLLGVITLDDVVDVIDEEAESDIFRLGGIGEQSDLYRDVAATTRSRFSWLFVNLLTAVLASSVIGLFEDVISKVVALAVLMPIVASMGGNAGTQTLTVAVRALAMRELTDSNAVRVLWKEVLVGAVNGLLFAAIAGGVVWLWFGDPRLALVIGAAMIINLLAAAFSGAVIPLAMQRFGIDPAVSSAVFLTTVTDVVGFFAFLGLAALILL